MTYISPARSFNESFNVAPDPSYQYESEISFRTSGVYAVNGRYSLLCTTENISRRGLTLRVMVKPKIGDRIDAIFDIIGRVKGEVSSVTEVGFVMLPDADILDRLHDQIAFLANSAVDDSARRHLRIKPRNPETNIRVAARATYPASVIDFSISGACIETDAPLNVGDKISFPRCTHAKIVRALGIRRYGIEFDRAFRPHEFSWSTRL